MHLNFFVMQGCLGNDVLFGHVQESDVACIGNPSDQGVSPIFVFHVINYIVDLIYIDSNLAAVKIFSLTSSLFGLISCMS